MKNYLVPALFSIAAISGVNAQNHFNPTVRIKDYMEPAIINKADIENAQKKLAGLKGRPNVLIFLVDDMGYGDLGVYGGGVMTGATTPNMDRLARQGKLMTSGYSQPTSTPTRAAIMTGRIPARSGLTRPLLTGENAVVNPWESENTAAKILSSNGYKTAISGKWHLGGAKGCLPNEVGFDEWRGISSVVSEFTQFVDQGLYPDLVNKPERLAAAKQVSDMYVLEGKKGEDNKQVYRIDSKEVIANLDQDFADYSIEFIKEAKNEKKPFYLIHSFIKVHDDNYPSKDFVGKSPAATPYKDALMEVDDIIGRVMNTLEEQDLDENTLVFITSDNGPCEDAWPDSGHTPFKAGKGTTWEGGVRVPLIAYWKNVIEPGQVSDGLFDLCDMFNTSLALAGVEDQLPATNYIDGVDQTSFLLTNNGASNRNAVFMYSEKNLTAVRWQEYKVHFKVFDVKEPRKNLDQSTLLNVGMSPWVYNLYSDPKEMVSTGHRFFEWGLPVVLKMTGDHLATYKQFPMKDIGLKKP